MLRNRADRKFLSAILLGGIAISTSATAGNLPEFSFVGPLEQLNCPAHSVEVLGSRLVSVSQELNSAICGTDASSAQALVVATGRLSSGGSLVLTGLVSLSGPNYVPGASFVYLKGQASAKSSVTGLFRVANTEVIAPESHISKGDMVEIVGTQPLPGGVLVATHVTITPNLEGSASGIDNSSVGSGIQFQSSIGSGAAIQSSIGSGAAVQSSVGSGKQMQSSIGSGVQLQSSIGSGAAIQSSIGSGKQLQSSIGSGAQSQSSVGSGMQLQSSIGSGKQLQSSIGSGAQTQSSIGSGVTVLSSVGSGKLPQSSIGSGVQSQSSVGSGVQLQSSIGSGLQ